MCAARCAPEQDAFSLLRATFPAGTLSGAPKVRAMEIIEELEGMRRGLYGGAVGYIGYDGQMDTCITIRTIVMQGKTLPPAGRRRHRRRQRPDLRVQRVDEQGSRRWPWRSNRRSEGCRQA